MNIQKTQLNPCFTIREDFSPWSIVNCALVLIKVKVI